MGRYRTGLYRMRGMGWDRLGCVGMGCVGIGWDVLEWDG
jgi:hypothetical protein